MSHPIRSLAQAYVYREQCQPFGIYAEGKMVGYVMVIYDYDIPDHDVGVTRRTKRAGRMNSICGQGLRRCLFDDMMMLDENLE